MYRQPRKYNAFTLVELLIVISVIATISVAVVATINPVEIIRRSNDTQKRTEAAKLKSAIDLYYINTNRYPWANTTPAQFNAYCISRNLFGGMFPPVCVTLVNVPISRLQFEPEFWDGSTEVSKDISNLSTLREGSIYVVFTAASIATPNICFVSSSIKEKFDNGTELNCQGTAVDDPSLNGPADECTCI